MCPSAESPVGAPTGSGRRGRAPGGVVTGSRSGPMDGQPVLDELVDLLDLERLEDDLFRGRSPDVSLQRVFGGQVAGQALVAAGRTVTEDRPVNSLHAYFLRGGDPAVPIVYSVERLRDGHSFSARRVVAIQHGTPIFHLTASFAIPGDGLEHQGAMPDVPDPESLPSMAQLVADAGKEVGTFLRLPRPIDIRYVDAPPWQVADRGEQPARQRVWMRADGRLPDDPLLHVCALTYASDMTLLSTVLIGHGLTFDDVRASSLDHAMWFQRPFRADEWFLYDMDSPSAAGARGLARGRIWSADGRHVVSVVQEGLLRVKS